MPIILNRSQLNALIGIAPALNLPVFTAQAATSTGDVTWTVPSPAAASLPSYTYPYAATLSPTAWSISSGSLPAGLAINSATGVLGGHATQHGTFTFKVRATNANGFTDSVTQTITTSLHPVITAQPVVGVPLYAEIPSLDETILAEQWYKNTFNGTTWSGPVAIAGATSNPYTPGTGNGTTDLGAFLSYSARTASGTWFSTPAWTTPGQVISQTAVLSKATPSAGFGYVAFNLGSLTYLSPMKIRAVYGNSYVDTVFAPGTVSGGLGAYGMSSVAGATASNVQPFGLEQMGPPAVIAPLTKPAATATRPSASTGAGYFIKNGGVYDANGHRLDIRGINRLHYDSGITGHLKSGMNVCREWLVFDSRFTTYGGPHLDALLAARCVPMVTMPGVAVFFSATCNGTNTITVTSMAGNYFGVALTAPDCVIFVGMQINPPSPNPGGFLACTVTGLGTGTGQTGTYTVSVVQPTIASPIQLRNYDPTFGSTGNQDPNYLLSMAQYWANAYHLLSAYDDRIMINVANEWGTSAYTNVVHGTIFGTTLTLTASSAANPIRTRMFLAGTGATTFQVVSGVPLTGTANAIGATYQITVSQTVSAATSFNDVTWRESYKIAIGIIRGAGYKCPIWIDAPGSGQDGGPTCITLRNHSTEVFNADPQKNSGFSWHVYQTCHLPGSIVEPFSALSALGQAQGMAFIIGEFGPGRNTNIGVDGTTITPEQIMTTAEACGLSGWIAWAWDDHLYTPPVPEQDNWYSFCYDYINGYTGSPPLASDLTLFGKSIVKHPVCGTLLAVPSTTL